VCSKSTRKRSGKETSERKKRTANAPIAICRDKIAKQPFNVLWVSGASMNAGLQPNCLNPGRGNPFNRKPEETILPCGKKSACHYANESSKASLKKNKKKKKKERLMGILHSHSAHSTHSAAHSSGWHSAFGF